MFRCIKSILWLEFEYLLKKQLFFICQILIEDSQSKRDNHEVQLVYQWSCKKISIWYIGMVMLCNVYKSLGKKVLIPFFLILSWTCTLQYHSFIFILRFDNFAWNCEIGTLLNFRGNIIYASSFLIFVKNFTCDAIHLVHILITYLLT